MTIKIAINGFGRIGRNITRALVEGGHDDFQLVAINDLAPLETNAHLLKFDTVHGRFERDVATTENTIDIGDGPIRVTSQRNPADLLWGDVDIVLECTGLFKSRETAGAHLENGSSRVLISAPGKDVDKTIVYGVNHELLGPDDHIVSNASCTTNCLAPVVKVLNDNIGIERGFMTTVHAYTGSQPMLDTYHKDLYRARAGAANMIPTSTGAAKAVGLVLPELEGRLGGVAIRVPLPNVSVVDLTFDAARLTSAEEINALMHAAADSAPLNGILGCTDRKLVSSDFNHDARSSIFVTDQTNVMDGKMARILTWYDNEWGYSNRMIDTAREMAKYL